jgi:hypothetical protein
VGPPPAPPHIEEIVFTAAPAPGAVEGNSEGLASVSSVGAKASRDRDGAAAGATDSRNPKQTEAKDDAHPLLSVAVGAPKRVIDVSPGVSWEESRVTFTDAVSETRNPREQSPEIQSPTGEPSVFRPDERSDAERQSAPSEFVAIPHESIEVVESQIAARGPRAQGRHTPRREGKDSGQPEPTGDGDPAEAVRDEPFERERVVHDYLKEVRAWVAAPPEFDPQRLERERDAERSLAGHGELVAIEPEVQLTAPQPDRRGALELQDLSLSIGTISIVIEEPKQTAAVALPPPPRGDSSPERPASEPTRLSRYYLGLW